MKAHPFTPQEIEILSDLDACGECLSERRKGGTSDEHVLRSSFAADNFTVCNVCAKTVISRICEMR